MIQHDPPCEPLEQALLNFAREMTEVKGYKT